MLFKRAQKIIYHTALICFNFHCYSHSRTEHHVLEAARKTAITQPYLGAINKPPLLILNSFVRNTAVSEAECNTRLLS
ncbi:hypothetical protein BKM16_13965 [Pseudomonas amygdali pv. morsprunorum]|nr:hypothetical protein BKM22_14645 [Pseudomonas amygdali pv. morsprunorum]POD44613.1 hypothetical protein BKM16_13965 [Pseudomonas amygdali pv. morsprunorum]POD48587.1 hypothetical protein BKM02_13975 [Pseudomonas amygdali pv. morsprunorum]